MREGEDDRPDSSPCPRCGAWVEEPGEFGVVRHEACGYCAHPSRDWDGKAFVCSICGDRNVAFRSECFRHGAFEGVFCPQCEREAGR